MKITQHNDLKTKTKTENLLNNFANKEHFRMHSQTQKHGFNCCCWKINFPNHYCMEYQPVVN